MRLNTKITFCFVFVACFASIVSTVGIQSTGIIEQEYEEVIDQQIPLSQAIEKVRYLGLKVISATNNYCFIRAENQKAGFYEDSQDVVAYQDFYYDAIEPFISSLKEYADHFPAPTEKEKAELKQINSTSEELIELSIKITELKKMNVSGAEILIALEELAGTEFYFREIIDGIIQRTNQNLNTKKLQVAESIGSSFNAMLLTSISLLFGATLIGLYLARRISTPILKLQKAATRLGKGSMDTRVEPTSSDEVGELAEAFNAMVETLQQTTVSKDYVENILSSMNDLVLVFTADGQLKKANLSALQHLGFTKEEIFTEKLENIIMEDELLKFICGQEPSDKVIFNHDATYVANGGTAIPVNVSGNYLKDSKGAVIGSVLVSQDFTERKRAQKALEEKTLALAAANEDLKMAQAQMLQREKMASIGQLAAGVAHEINNPIGFVKSNLSTLSKYLNKITDFISFQDDTLKQQCDSETSALVRQERKKVKLDYVIEDLEDLIVESKEGTERVQKIVQNLKTFSRLDDAELKPVDINQCLESTINIAWNEIKYNSTLNKELGELPEVVCNAQELNQVFLNLIVNASHAIKDKGEITLKTWADDDDVCVSVSDTGHGIPEEKLSRIFEPFFTTKDVGKGTGLGLSISYEIIKKHQGEILVDSTVGVGTTFTLKLPINQQT